MASGSSLIRVRTGVHYDDVKVTASAANPVRKAGFAAFDHYDTRLRAEGMEGDPRKS